MLENFVSVYSNFILENAIFNVRELNKSDLRQSKYLNV